MDVTISLLLPLVINILGGLLLPVGAVLCVLEILPYKRCHHGFSNDKNDNLLCCCGWSKCFKVRNLRCETHLDSRQTFNADRVVVDGGDPKPDKGLAGHGKMTLRTPYLAAIQSFLHPTCTTNMFHLCRRDRGNGARPAKNA